MPTVRSRSTTVKLRRPDHRWRSSNQLTSGVHQTRRVSIRPRLFSHALVEIVIDLFEITSNCIVKKELHLIVEDRLVLLHRQHVVPALVDDLLCDGFLAAHRINSDRGALQVEQLQQFGYGGDLVAFCIGGQLSEAKVVGRGPSADHMNGCLVTGSIKRASQCLAVDGYQSPFRRSSQGFDPREKKAFQCVRIHRGKHRAESIVRRNPLREFEE